MIFPLVQGSQLPDNARFFVLGKTFKVRLGSMGTFYIVEAADPQTLRAMRGQQGLISAEDLEIVGIVRFELRWPLREE